MLLQIYENGMYILERIISVGGGVPHGKFRLLDLKALCRISEICEGFLALYQVIGEVQKGK